MFFRMNLRFGAGHRKADRRETDKRLLEARADLLTVRQLASDWVEILRREPPAKSAGRRKTAAEGNASETEGYRQ